eukprot:257664_1
MTCLVNLQKKKKHENVNRNFTLMERSTVATPRINEAIQTQLLMFNFTEKEITSASKSAINCNDINNVLDEIGEMKLKRELMDPIPHQNDNEHIIQNTKSKSRCHDQYPPFLCPKLPCKQLMDLVLISHSTAMHNGFLISSKRTLTNREENQVKYTVGMRQNQGEKPVNTVTNHSKQTTKSDPFTSPFMKGSHICDLNANYRLLLNKYPVLPCHLLIVSKHFVDQSVLLTAKDFDITWKVFESIAIDPRNRNSLMYFNSGLCAGATQKHRHLQMLPNVNVGKYLLLNTICDDIQNATDTSHKNTVAMWNKFPFVHGIMTWDASAPCDGTVLYKYYILILKFIQRHMVKQDTFSYNLLMTSHMMMVIPRKCGAFIDENCNKFWFSALPFGGLVCCSKSYMKIFDAAGLMKVLRYCCFPLKNVDN